MEKERTTYNIGSSKVVQKVRYTSTTSSCDGDIQHPLCSGVCFFERQITNVRPQDIFQDTDIQEMPFFPPSFSTTYERPYPCSPPSAFPIRTIGEGCQVDGVACQELQ